MCIRDSKSFAVRINDREILKAMAVWAGFPEEAMDQVFITLDKMDKIGGDGVSKELTELGFDEAAVKKYMALITKAGPVSYTHLDVYKRQALLRPGT